MVLGWEGELWVVKGVVGGGSQAGGGRAIWGSWGRGLSVLVLQLAASVPLAIVPNWPSAQPPTRQLRNPAKGEDGVGSLGGGELKGVQVGRKSSFLLTTSNSLWHTNTPF